MERNKDGRINIWKERQMDRQTNRQMERNNDGRINIWKERQKERKTEV